MTTPLDAKLLWPAAHAQRRLRVVRATHRPEERARFAEELRPNRNIRRVDRDSLPAHGWLVQFKGRDFKPSKWFSDKSWGGSEQALAAARAWRDEQIKARQESAEKNKVEKSAAEKRERFNCHPRVGEVARQERLVSDGGQPRASAFWTIGWTDESGMEWSRKYSVGYWGEEAARRKAVEMREQRLQWVQTVKAWPTAPVRKPAAMVGIKRDKALQGWGVNIARASLMCSKSFSDVRYGGSPAALAAAKAWRDEALAGLDAGNYLLWRRTRARVDSSSGIAGVSRWVYRAQRGEKMRVWAYWRARWVGLDGKQRQRLFRVAKYGEEGAKALAAKARQEAIASIAQELDRRTRRKRAARAPRLPQTVDAGTRAGVTREPA